MIYVAFFEDHPLVINSLENLINKETDLNLVFKARTKKELYESLENHQEIDVLLLDLLADDVNGLEIYEYVHKKFKNLKVISLTSLNSPILIENLLLNGVRGYVNKNQDMEDIVTAIRDVNNGNIHLPEDYQFMIDKFQLDRKLLLSDREVEIITYIIKEFTTAEIAEQLNISVATVENHRKNIFQKLNVKNAAGMVREVNNLGYHF